MEILFDDIPLIRSTSMTRQPAAVLLAVYIVVAEARIKSDKLSGTIQNDILKSILPEAYIFFNGSFHKAYYKYI